MTNWSRWLMTAACVGGLTAATAIASEAPSENQPPATSSTSILVALASDDYATRQRMTRQLLADDALPAAALADLLNAAHTPEQRHRLLRVAHHHTLRNARRHLFPATGDGSLGIAHQTLPPGTVPGLDQAVIEVTATLPGFPAYAHLQPGDLIVRIEGEAFPPRRAAEHFREQIKQRPAGEPIELTVSRDGQLFPCRLNLASLQALHLMYRADSLSLRQAYQKQWLNVRVALLAGAPAPTALLLEPGAGSTPVAAGQPLQAQPPTP